MKRLTKYRLPFILLLYGAVLLGLGGWLDSFGFDFFNIAVFCIVAFFFLVFFTFVLSRIHLYYHSKSAISVIHLGIISMFSAIGAWSTFALSRTFINSDDGFEVFLSDAYSLSFVVFFLFLLLATNQFWIDKHIVEQDRTVNQLLEKERALAKAELSQIQEQFKPHFIFNSLNSISALIIFDPAKAREMIQLLSDFLRASVNQEADKIHSLKEEFDYLNLYLSIEKVRFEDRLIVELPYLSLIEECQVPALILQPIVENAIKFGLYDTVGKTTINIEVEKREYELIIRISNPFDSTTNYSSKGSGFGIDSIRKKMYLFYKRNDLVKLEQENAVFTFQLTIPINEKSSNN